MARKGENDKPDDMISTWVTIRGEGSYPFTESSVAIHRRDLADVEEPYLSAIKAARGIRNGW